MAVKSISIVGLGRRFTRSSVEDELRRHELLLFVPPVGEQRSQVRPCPTADIASSKQ